MARQQGWFALILPWRLHQPVRCISPGVDLGLTREAEAPLEVQPAGSITNTKTELESVKSVLDRSRTALVSLNPLSRRLETISLCFSCLEKRTHPRRSW